MRNDLKSNLWAEVNRKMRSCHMSQIEPGSVTEEEWKDAFDLLVEAIKDERKQDPAFAPELEELTEATGNEYGFEDILEEYFDHLEDNGRWADVVDSCDKMISLFKWDVNLPSEYMFRKGNALHKSGRCDEAEAFGAEWLEEYPYDLFAAAANVFLKVALGKNDDAEELTRKYLRDDFVCGNPKDTFFMAAYRLLELTDNENAKRRVERKIAEYSDIVDK